MSNQADSIRNKKQRKSFYEHQKKQHSWVTGRATWISTITLSMQNMLAWHWKKVPTSHTHTLGTAREWFTEEFCLSVMRPQWECGEKAERGMCGGGGRRLKYNKWKKLSEEKKKGKESNTHTRSRVREKESLSMKYVKQHFLRFRLAWKPVETLSFL